MARRIKASLVRRFGKKCHYCRQEFPLGRLTGDHIIPVVFGGPTTLWNMVLACGPCNEDKDLTVGLCRCERCTEAVQKFLLYRRPETRRQHGRIKYRTVEEAEQKIIARLEGINRSLERVGDQPLARASLRGYAHGLRTALNILRTVVAHGSQDEDRLDLVLESSDH